MFNKRKIKALYITEGICNKCGGRMVSTGLYLATYPEQYIYECEKCGWKETYQEQYKPGILQYELEEDKDEHINELFNQTIAKVRNNPGITYLKKRLTVSPKACPHCGEQLEYEVMKTPYGDIQLIYECPKGCQLSFAESNEFFNRENKEIITYEEEEDV